ncbi:MAG: site-specific integrase, partial [Methanocorpusculum sp.]|nr:site-specific integrase [Methanocorpusculum sp.]
RLDGKLDQDGKPAKLSDQTLKHHYRCISAILQDAVEWQIIAHNPAARVKPPKTERKQITCYDEEQTAILLKAIANEPLKCRVLVFLEIVTGLRGGEMMGLEWKHVDFENNTITVKQASQYLPGMGIFTKDPKNKGSERTIAIPSEITALLKEYRKEQLERQLRIGSQWKGSDRLFTTWDGMPGYPGWPGKWLHSFIEKKNLPHTTFHGLRHLNATLLIKAGIPLKNISTRLGHSVVGTTADIYGHSLKSVDRQAAETMGDIIIGSKLATIK